MLNLPEVTIWTMVWNEDRRWIIQAGKVLRYCKSVIQCPRMVLFTSSRLASKDYPWDTIEIPKLDWQGYNIFINRVVQNHIDTKFAMSVHEDGFPIDLNQWDTQFLDYDYIGAPWSDNVVGNGGFNIESRKFMDLKSEMPLTEEDFRLPSDRLVCSARRGWLEQKGARFAPVPLAIKFSTEQIGGEQPSFGFHGRLVSAPKYRQGWKMINSMAVKFSNDGFSKIGNKVVPAPRNFIKQPPTQTTGTEKIALVYVYPVFGKKYNDAAKEFVASYRATMPTIPHDLYIMSNGGTPTVQMLTTIGSLKCHWRTYDNSAYDIGAFQKAAQEIECELIVFFGSTTTFRKKGWLERMWEVYQKYGDALYGTMGNRGDARVNVQPHIRTTGFWLPRSLMNRYPIRVTQANRRYEFEHGKSCLTGWITSQGLKALVVTWNKEYEWEQWDSIPNGFHRGNQSDLLCRDRLTDPPYYQPT